MAEQEPFYILADYDSKRRTASTFVVLCACSFVAGFVMSYLLR